MNNLRNLIQKNIKEIPYEGKEINVDGIEVLIEGLLKGMIPESQKYKLTKRGYFRDGKNFSRHEIVERFLSNLKSN